MGLNTAFLQLGAGDYQGKLVWDPHQVHALCPAGIDRWGADHDLCLLLSHQGPDWLTPAARELGESEIAPAGRFAAHLFGHNHEARISYLRQGGDPNAVRLCQGCSVFGMEHHGEPPRLERAHGYTAGQIRFTDRDAELRLWPRIATKGTGRWRYVPDQEHAVLQDDQGTAPETLHLPKPAPVPPDPDRDAEPAADLVPSASRPAPPHSTLPARCPFFGRATELARVAACLAPDYRGWGIAIDGPGGIGKTALALEASHRAPAEQYPLKLWITAQGRALHPDGERRLADQQVHDFDAMLAELGRALGREDIPRSDPAGRAELVRHALAGQRALLVFDNLETLNQAERRRVFDLMERLPEGCRAILTSRRRTGGAWAGQWLRLDRLDRAGADALIAELGLRWLPAGRLTADERDRLYAETGGNPLLLTWTLGQLGLDRGRCRTLDAAIGRLQEAQAGNDPLGFVFGDLVETFTADEIAVLAALSHFTEPAPPGCLLPLTGLSRTAVETALDDLRDRALLIVDEDRDQWLLPALAARYLRRVRPEAVGETGGRLADRAYALAVENGFQKYDRFPVLDAAWAEIKAALPLLLAGDNRRLQGTCVALKQFLDFSGRWDDRLALSLAAESRAEAAGDRDNAGWRAHDAGWCHLQRGNADGVLDCAGRANAHWQAARTGARERGYAIRLRGMGYRLAKDHPAAIAALREALDIWRGLAPDSQDVAKGLNSLAIAPKSAGRLDEAESHYREALAIARALPYPEGVALVAGRLAELALGRGDWPAAESLAREALALDEPLGRKELIAAHSQHLAIALTHQGRGAEGRCHAERAVAIFTALRSPYLAEATATLAECPAQP
ncbi:tetratricopeptide repeat protein [uncultured Thiodictyon sp.]|jgi:tetratricopeptide (TPR) repeat protein|uniref:tetratricopeptide repeat protein n=1 Tax=uncultured Thiodictyon sp. TaxID=1846217 RepID=UPI0025FB57EF|nr:tetratricopeptide repeat protein [uncultured Thiodictyon sp.]